MTATSLIATAFTTAINGIHLMELRRRTLSGAAATWTKAYSTDLAKALAAHQTKSVICRA